MPHERPHQLIQTRLSALLGPHAARNALSVFSRRIGSSSTSIDTAEALRLRDGLRPALRTILGAVSADRVVTMLTWEL
jgi:hypothetical protein